MASHPPGQCCTIGVKHEGEAKGKLETIAGTETYVATPRKPHEGTAILLLTDFFGHKLINAQLIADQFAENGYFTVVPDLFHGDAVPCPRPDDFDIMKWAQGKFGGGEGEGHLPPRVDPVVKAALKWLREEKDIKKIGAIGYCYGAKYVVRFLEKDGGIDAGVLAHPSFVDAEELQKIAGPLSIVAAETDHIFPIDKRYESEKILQGTKQPYQMALYSGVEHGFAVRADLSKPSNKFAKEQAFFQAVQWFDQWIE